MVAQWTTEVRAEQARAEHELRTAREAHTPPPSGEHLETLIRSAGDLVTILAHTDAGD